MARQKIQYTREIFIQMSKEKYGENTFIYNKFKYNGWNKEGTIDCPSHGPMTIVPRLHLNNFKPCKQCIFEQKKLEFFTQMKNIFGDKYDFGEFKFSSIYQEELSTVICNDHGKFDKIPNNLLRGFGCPECIKIKRAKILTERNKNNTLPINHIDQYIIDNNLQIERLTDCNNVLEEADFRCKIHKEITWKTTSCDVKRNRGGCPKCGHQNMIDKLKFSNEEVDQCIKDLGLSIERVDNYDNNYTDMRWRCKVRNKIFVKKFGRIKRRPDEACPLCNPPKLINEKLTGTTLNELGLKAKHRHRIYDPIFVGQAYCEVDYSLKDHNLFIEFNGSQHYEVRFFKDMNLEEANLQLARRQVRDQILRDYCAINNIRLLEIDGRKYRQDKLVAYLKEKLHEFGII
jgi:hypothetical protein